MVHAAEDPPPFRCANHRRRRSPALVRVQSRFLQPVPCHRHCRGSRSASHRRQRGGCTHTGPFQLCLHVRSWPRIARIGRTANGQSRCNTGSIPSVGLGFLVCTWLTIRCRVAQQQVPADGPASRARGRTGTLGTTRVACFYGWYDL